MIYRTRLLDLSGEIADLEKRLAAIDAKRKMADLTSWSKDYLRARLYERYGGKLKRTVFTEDELRKKASMVATEYPIVLSTAFSSTSCLRGMTFDYLIMDEASQVDIATGALALSCARNAVIVGDLKQLPNVVKDEALYSIIMK